MKFVSDSKLINDMDKLCVGYSHAEIIHALEFLKLKILIEGGHN
ncbi:hypothetical protein [Lutibacter sp.]